jgi:hypothetical protein
MFSSYLTIVSLIKTVHKYLCCCCLKLFLHLFPNQTCVRVSCSPLQIICPSTNPHLEHYNGTVYIVKNIKLLINSYNFSVKYDLIYPSISIMGNCFHPRSVSKKYLVHAPYFPVPLDLLKMLKASLLKLSNLNAVHGSGITQKRYKL